MAAFDLVGLLTTSDDMHTRVIRALSVVTTLTLALYAWSPLVATSALGVAAALSLLVEHDSGTLMAGSLAAFLVLRLASTPLILSYICGLLLFTVVAASGIASRVVSTGDLAVYLLIATMAGSLGVALRMAYARSHRLADQLVEQEEHERQAITAERQWIAGELHDSIAHQLTVISLHTQLLDDDEMREASQEAIRGASRKALSDLRFIIKLAEDAPAGTEVPSGDLAAAIEDACAEFRGAGHSTIVAGDPADEGIPRGVEITLARVVRESATNIIKYAGSGEVRFAIDVQPQAITLTIQSPLAHGTAPRVSSSTGTGLNRMAERVLGVSGGFSAGPVGDKWLVRAYVPLNPTTNSRNAALPDGAA